jgi:hypothetical protein
MKSSRASLTWSVWVQAIGVTAGSMATYLQKVVGFGSR